MTPDVKSKPTKTRKTLSKAELDDQLDEALEETFPASDPVTVGDVSDETPERPESRQAPQIDKALVEKLARDVEQKKMKKKGAT